MNPINYIAIGSSAGGLNALQELIQTFPSSSDYTYIILQHQSTDSKSRLASVLSKYSNLEINVPNDNETLQSRAINIIPPDFELIDKNGDVVAIAKAIQHNEHHPSIDDCFSNLTSAYGNQVLGIILSGTGNDGCKGLKNIRNAGGITIAQSPDEAQYSEMPESSIDSNGACWALNIKNIGTVLNGLSSMNDSEEDALLNVFQVLLASSTKMNIDSYKKKTVWRRIHKRKTLLGLASIPEYLQHLLRKPEESKLLYSDLLIGVTRFFRDKEAFESLAQNLKQQIKGFYEQQNFKIWIPACSTGEEVYSIAIVMAELLEELQLDLNVRIYASDIDEIALKNARNGVYPSEALNHVPPELVNKYFRVKGKDYEISAALKRIIVFTHHNLLTDPPFIQTDLISCRNALIYFELKAQEEVFTIFYSSLNDEGLLFLGASENTTHGVNYFKPIDSKWRIYVKDKLSNPPKIPRRFFQKMKFPVHEEKPIDKNEKRFSELEKLLAYGACK